MGSFRLTVYALCLALLTLLAGGSLAAEFSPALEAQLSDAAPTDMISAIMILESPIDIRALDARLHETKAPLAVRHQEIIGALKYNAETTQPALQAELDDAVARGDVVGYTPYWVENLFVIRATRQFVESLRERGDLKYVTENFQAELIEPVGSESSRIGDHLDSESIEPGQFAVGATRVNQELGITGQGALVASMDYGVDVTHPAVGSRWRGYFIDPDSSHHCWFDALGVSPDVPVDNNGHGTHVTGIMCGRQFVSSDTITVGTAPDARWIACNAIDQDVGAEFDNDVLAGYQWLTDPDGNPSTLDDVPDVVCNSWGVHAIHGYVQCYDFWNTAILNCEAAGPVMVFAAGNENSNGLRSPAIYAYNETQLFAVGSVDATNYSAPYPLSSFSALGPSHCPPDSGAIKPEIVAPGTEVRSCLPGGGYGTKNGTSMATPHVAGVVALMREVCPDCDPTTIKQTLLLTAIDDGYGAAGPDNEFGSGMLDAYEAVLAVASMGRVAGVVDDGTDPLSGVAVSVVGGTNRVFTNDDGEYSMPLNEGTYDLEYTKFGFEVFTVYDVSVTAEDTTDQNVTLIPANFGLLSGTVTDCYASPAIGAEVTILNTPEDPVYTDSSGYYEIILPQAHYDVRARVCGCGEQIIERVPVLSGSATQDFTIPADPTFLCGTPDSWGYVACDDCDENGPTCEWFEISPDEGGPGTWTGITGDDASGLLNLPFTFRLYGTDYTSVYINSNGWLTFDGPNTEWTNETFPDAEYGHAVAPFWDDLNPNDIERICYYYHLAENAMIIEWYQIGHYDDLPSTETFQVWIHNVTIHPTPTGDSQIRFQYLDMTSLGSATVGIQNGTIANLYEFDGVRSSTERGVEDGRAICVGGHEGLPFGTLQGTVTDASTLQPIPGATVRAADGSGYAVTDPSGDYVMNLPGGAYDVICDKAGCASDTAESVSIINESITVQNFQLSTLPLIMVLSEDFDGGDPGWVHDAPVDWEDNWHMSSEQMRSGTYSYKCGDTGGGSYDNFCDSRLTTPVIENLPNDAQLGYYHQLEAETYSASQSWDGAVVEISVDSGPFTIVEPLTGYPYIFRPGSEGPLPGEPCFSGDVPPWDYVQHDLSAYAGSDVQIRWRFGTDYSVVMEGWYVDDVEVWGYGNPNLEPPDDLTIYLAANGVDLVCRWGDTGAREYDVYSAADPDGPFDTFEGTTTDTSFTFEAPPLDLAFYVVESSNGGLPSSVARRQPTPSQVRIVSVAEKQGMGDSQFDSK